LRYPAEETAAKHERIVKEASRLFRQRGFENVTVSEVMKAAGLTHGAFYAKRSDLSNSSFAWWRRTGEGCQGSAVFGRDS
jgi:hypothetical protein